MDHAARGSEFTVDTRDRERDVGAPFHQLHPARGSDRALDFTRGTARFAAKLQRRESVTVHGDVAWATVEENLIGRRGTSGAVAGLNVFVRGDDGEWRIVVHHGAAIAARPPS